MLNEKFCINLTICYNQLKRGILKMTKTIHAIYEHGVLKPLEPIEGLKENTEVMVTVSLGKEGAHPILRFAGILSEDKANTMMKIVEEEFERINPDEWKD